MELMEMVWHARLGKWQRAQVQAVMTLRGGR